MKCITIRQPWAWLVVNDLKPVENRSWPTKIRGEVLIHAAKGTTTQEWESAMNFCYGRGLATFAPLAQTITEIEAQRGCIIGKATLTDCVTEHKSRYFTGPYGHVLTNPQRCEPYPLKGQLGYFNVPDEIVSQLKWIPVSNCP